MSEIYTKIEALAERMLFLRSFNSKVFAKREEINWAAIVKGWSEYTLPCCL